MAEKQGYRFTDKLSEAIEYADYLSLNIPYRPETKNIISKPQFDLMKKSAFLLNCARGELINEKDLYDALFEKKIAGAAIDVMQVEPIQKDHPLLTLDNIIVTPHMAPLTRETTAEIVMIAAEGTLAVLNGQKWPFVANPEVYDHPRWKA
jgi:D-3-phosphoglycerate dehydrogenase